MYSIWTSEMNDSNTTRDKREKLGILCDKVLAYMWNNIMSFKGGFTLVKIVYFTL